MESGGAIVEQDCHGVDVLNWFAAMRIRSARAAPAASASGPLRRLGFRPSRHRLHLSQRLEGWLLSIKHTAGFRDVKEQFFGSKGVLETARTYYKLHGPIANSPTRTRTT